ncbi:hypothetical protein UFOVP1219_49 [uncultured Caudovirales phage]|uniref:Uncharacterized protein n=1 Tax=uncultured Caudovirales phage TaxID=2100421 RepID=A0A6J7WR49_9CAUD|nr:hypothetical protein UFOVP476_21 [uncultured Caudovirales phage]CAB4176679.1 hypothetical protein UFOVP986_54 [uncultured Caudovirales phage]CAB4191435.1 hypothetical protein UFOVP1219_49 [uncultured Caudovirales phage]CAB4223203.1 hypothetical protein UFOVP1671_24 [uncultured Caudovirales phage]CAB5220489.1 hypothetical protein UFOVP358_9 [uncultured Caudovirales phage]
MSLYIKAGGAWNEITGTERPYVKVSSAWKSVSEIYIKVGGAWKQAYQYDNTGPVVTLGVSSTVATSDTITWTITDAGSGVASATIQQVFLQGFVELSANTYSIPGGSLASGTYAFSIPTNRRNTPSGDYFQVKYRIVAVDNAGNTTTTPYSSYHYTSPYGDYLFAPTGADARNIGNTAWLNQTTADEGMVGVSGTKAYGAWFYGSSAFSDRTLGWKPDSGSIFLQRPGSAQTNRGNTGTFSIQAHTSPTKSGALSYVGSAITQSISGNDGVGNPALNNAQLNGLRDSTIYGFALTAHDNSPGFLRGLTVSSNNNPFGIYSGTVFLSYL